MGALLGMSVAAKLTQTACHLAWHGVLLDGHCRRTPLSPAILATIAQSAMRIPASRLVANILLQDYSVPAVMGFPLSWVLRSASQTYQLWDSQAMGLSVFR